MDKKDNRQLSIRNLERLENKNQINRREFFALSYLSTAFLVKLFTPSNALAWVATRMRRGKVSSASYVDTGDIANSLRFRSSANAYLSKTPASAGNRLQWTLSFWVKRGDVGSTTSAIFSATISAGSTEEYIGINNDNILFNDGSFGLLTKLPHALRDPSAWYHVVFVYDAANATQANRGIFYINGVQQTANTNAIALNRQSYLNSTTTAAIGRFAQIAGSNLNGYLSRVCFVDGQALSPSSFGYTNTISNSWVSKSQAAIKAVVESGGTNSFMLDFDNGTSTATLGNDKSSKGNNWTTNNISLTAGSTYDWMKDTPTNNYCTLNPLYYDPPMALSSANLNSQTTTFGNWSGAGSTIAVSSGKWYWETTAVSAVNPGSEDLTAGIQNINLPLPTSAGGYASGSFTYITSGSKINNSVTTAYGATWTNGDVIGVALDLDAGTLEFYKNGVSQGVAFTGLSGTFTPSVHHSSLSVAACNFGQRPYSYSVPSGYKSLCTNNLPTPAIVNAKKHFDIALYTGNATARSISTNDSGNNLVFAPGLVWAKARTGGANNHVLFDSNRGVGNYLMSASTSAEVSNATMLTSFNSNGFSVGTDSTTAINGNGLQLVSWLWKAGGGAVTNTQGSVTSQVSANPLAGFSIVTYTGTLSAAGTFTVGHGLGVAPSMIITKSVNATSDWNVLHKSLASWSHTAYLNTIVVTDSSSWGARSAPTSTVFAANYTTGNGVNGHNHIAYCFTEISGYSKIGSYTGNGSADGPFLFCGFRPRWVLIKRIDAAANSRILDTARDTYNPAQFELYPNLTNAEQTFSAIDILSNGFKVRNTDTSYNSSGGTYIFIAMAEVPFKYANAR